MGKIAAGLGALAGLSILPERWTRPIIGQIVIPAHAQTSGENEPPSPQPPQICTAASGCYIIVGTDPDTPAPELIGRSFQWPGGTGLQNEVCLSRSDAYPDCNDSDCQVWDFALTDSLAEAQLLLDSETPILLIVTPASGITGETSCRFAIKYP